jgi:hypothetical protein
MNTLRRILRDRALVAGLVIVLLLVLAAVFATPLANFPGHVTGFDPSQRL